MDPPDTADALRYLIATKSRTISQRKLRGYLCSLFNQWKSSAPIYASVLVCNYNVAGLPFYVLDTEVRVGLRFGNS